MLNICLPTSVTRRLAERLTDGLTQELDLTPKPGLVDRWNRGSHPDLSYELMQRSIALLGDYFQAFARGLEDEWKAPDLRQLGQDYEVRMLAAFDTNTHRGAVFLGGILLAGVYRSGDLDTARVPGAIAGFVAELFADRLPGGTVGSQVRTRYGAGGIVREALEGLPALFRVGLPALELARALGFDRQRACWLVMARLMQKVEDTTALRRCGPEGLARLRADGVRLEALLLAGLDPVPFLVSANDDYCRLRLTMGGVADLLGLCIAWDDCDRDLSAQDFEV